MEDKKEEVMGLLYKYKEAFSSRDEIGHGIKYPPSIWQSYFNAILECLESKKHCKVIMEDLLLFTPMKKLRMAKLEDLLKAL